MGTTNERSKIKVCVCKAVCGAAGGVSVKGEQAQPYVAPLVCGAGAV